MTSAHLLNNSKAQKTHDDIVDDIVKLFAGHEVVLPDSIQGEIGERRPDIAIDGKLAIEVKVLNPTIEDWKIDVEAQKKWEKSRSTDSGGKMNPLPIQAEIRRAIKQLRNRPEKYKVVVLYSPLVWQMSSRRLKDMLTGLHTFTLVRKGIDTRLAYHSKTSVPLQRGVEQIVDAVVYINEAHWKSRTVFRLNRRRCALLKKISEDSEYMWTKKELSWF